MPLIKSRDQNGNFYKWGDRGKKYYYRPYSPSSRNAAKHKALKQAFAIQYSEERRV
jgi:hypothetical protein